MRKSFLLLLLFLIPSLAMGKSTFSGSTLSQVTFGSCPDAYAATRTVPTGMPTPPILPTCVWGPANVTFNESLLTAFETKYPAVLSSSNIITVDPTNGNDSACGFGKSTPCATLNHVLKNISGTGGLQINFKCPSSGIYYGSGSAPFDVRWTDPPGQNPILITSDTPGCKLAIQGDNIATDIWTAKSGHTNMYQTTINSAQIGSSGILAGVYYADGTNDTQVDEWGRAFPQRLYTAFPNAWLATTTYSANQYVSVGNRQPGVCYEALQSNNTNHAVSDTSWWTPVSCDVAGLANLDTLSTGYYYSVSTFTLYAKLGGADLTQPSNAARLAATYYQIGNNQPRFFLYGTTVMTVGFELFGMEYLSQEYYDGAVYHPSHLYEQSGTVFMSPQTYGHQQRGADAFSEYVISYANGGDGWNTDLGADSASGNPYVGTHMLADCWSLYNGDPETYGPPGLPGIFPNVNGASSHNGYAFYFGVVGEDNVGPEWADTSNTSSSPVIPSETWFVGAIGRNKNPSDTGNIAGGQVSGVSGASYGDARNRLVWFDSSYFYNEPDSPISIQFNAACKIYNTKSDEAAQYVGSPTCASYTPDVP